jgi:hypothetical protein
MCVTVLYLLYASLNPAGHCDGRRHYVLRCQWQRTHNRGVVSES